jgi:6-phosphogluconolactonase
VIAADLRVSADADDLAARAGAAVSQLLEAAVRQRGSASIALSGGRTPQGLYRHLASCHRDGVAWDRVEFFWGDERSVPFDDARSNFRMARESLIDPLSVPPEHVHPIPTDLAQEEAADAYERTLRSRFATEWPRFDLVLLGVGDDGHTASLFPGSPALQMSDRWVAATTAPVAPHDRLTLTLPAITHAAAIYVLAAGRSKAEAIRCALADKPDPRCPVSFIRATRGPIVWWLDSEAATLVIPESPA